MAGGPPVSRRRSRLWKHLQSATITHHHSVDGAEFDVPEAFTTLTFSDSISWKTLLSPSTQQEVMSLVWCRFPEIRLISINQQLKTSWGSLHMQD